MCTVISIPCLVLNMTIELFSKKRRTVMQSKNHISYFSTAAKKVLETPPTPPLKTYYALEINYIIYTFETRDSQPECRELVPGVSNYSNSLILIPTISHSRGADIYLQYSVRVLRTRNKVGKHCSRSAYCEMSQILKTSLNWSTETGFKLILLFKDEG